jgi:hypothetical protein
MNPCPPAPSDTTAAKDMVYVYRATLPRNDGGMPGGSRTPTRKLCRSPGFQGRPDVACRILQRNLDPRISSHLASYDVAWQA